MRVAVIVTARPSWAKLSPVVGALLSKGAEVQLIACASALLERYGAVVQVMRQEYPDVPITEVWSTIEGATPLTSAKETGTLLMELAGTLGRWRYAAVVVCADRHEVLAAAQAASYLGLRCVHLQGGERSGSIDDKVRDAVTHLSDVHCVCTDLARHRVYGLTGDWDAVHLTGCPSIDVAATVADAPPVTDAELGGVGCAVDPQGRFLVLLHHPVTDTWQAGAAELRAILEQLERVRVPLVAFWPGQDAGSEAMAKVYRTWREERPMHSVRLVRNLAPVRFLKLLTQAACLVGNSSAGIRECSYLGVPVVNIGTRQQGRERAANVRDVPDVMRCLETTVEAQIAHGPYPRSLLYGDGHAAARIADVVLR